jgi:hypothetical protein
MLLAAEVVVAVPPLHAFFYHALEMTLVLRHLCSIALATAVFLSTGSSTEAEK